MKKFVILVHGLMNSSVAMKKIEKSCKTAGYLTYCFNYNSLKYSEKVLEQLHEVVCSLESQEIHFVGHSMGGLVIRNYISHYKEKEILKKIKSIVTIATPHNGSVCARNLSKTILARYIEKAGTSGLLTDITKWDNLIPLGCIAGLSSSILSKNLFLREKAPSDGTVLLKEAIIDNCTASVIINSSHTGLLFNKEVNKQILHFLQNNKFI